jgi:hypothetical protein
MFMYDQQKRLIIGSESKNINTNKYETIITEK